MENTNQESFKIIIALMQIIGWYPQDRNPKFFLIQGYILYFLLMVVFTLLIIADILIRKDYDSLQIIYLSEIISYCFKVFPFLNGRQRDNTVKCINYFNGRNFNPKDDIEKKLSEYCVSLCQNITKIFTIGVLNALVLYIGPALFTTVYVLPLHIWVPYNPTSGPLAYYFTTLCITIACSYDMCGSCLIDPLLGGLAYHAVTQLKILKHRVLNLQSIVKCGSLSRNNSSKRSILKNLKKCIKHHKAILQFVTDYENCFSWCIFSQFFGTTIVMCFCCIELARLPLISLGSVRYGLYLLIGSSQVLFYCFFGTLLYEENNTLSATIYECKWYEYDVQIRKMLIMFMERSKQPMLLTAGKIIDLTLDTFVTVVKRSYSLVAVLK